MSARVDLLTGVFLKRPPLKATGSNDDVTRAINPNRFDGFVFRRGLSATTGVQDRGMSSVDVNLDCRDARSQRAGKPGAKGTVDGRATLPTRECKNVPGISTVSLTAFITASESVTLYRYIIKKKKMIRQLKYAGKCRETCSAVRYSISKLISVVSLHLDSSIRTKYMKAYRIQMVMV